MEINSLNLEAILVFQILLKKVLRRVGKVFVMGEIENNWIYFVFHSDFFLNKILLPKKWKKVISANVAFIKFRPI